MTGIEAINHLRTQDSYTVSETPDGYSISWHGNEPVKVTKEDLLTMALPNLTRRAHAGRNVEHITRVTGYFSKVSGWNKGKVAELVDRQRTPIQ